MCRIAFFLAVSLAAIAAPHPLSAHPGAKDRPRGGAQASQGRSPVGGREGRPRASETGMKSKLNSWIVGLAAGQLEGAPLRFAAELARVLDDGDNMRVLPIVTRGIFDN